MAKVMMTLRCSEGPPTVEALRERLLLAEDEIDTSFGVVLVDDRENVYTFLVEESVASKVQPGGEWSIEGPFSNPSVEPCGPPEGGGASSKC